MNFLSFTSCVYRVLLVFIKQDCFRMELLCTSFNARFWETWHQGTYSMHANHESRNFGLRGNPTWQKQPPGRWHVHGTRRLIKAARTQTVTAYYGRGIANRVTTTHDSYNITMLSFPPGEREHDSWLRKTSLLHKRKRIYASLAKLTGQVVLRAAQRMQTIHIRFVQHHFALFCHNWARLCKLHWHAYPLLGLCISFPMHMKISVCKIHSHLLREIIPPHKGINSFESHT